MYVRNAFRVQDVRKQEAAVATDAEVWRRQLAARSGDGGSGTADAACGKAKPLPDRLDFQSAKT
eukprot:6510336-Lingulodinium_polyedra.AAC.1